MSLISVVTPFFNETTYLPQTLQSLKDQTFADFEAIFVDDASTDEGADFVRDCGNERFHLIRNPQNYRNLKSRNDTDAGGTFIRDLYQDGKEVPSTRETNAEHVAADSLFEIPVIHTTDLFSKITETSACN